MADMYGFQLKIDRSKNGPSFRVKGMPRKHRCGRKPLLSTPCSWIWLKLKLLQATTNDSTTYELDLVRRDIPQRALSPLLNILQPHYKMQQPKHLARWDNSPKKILKQC